MELSKQIRTLDHSHNDSGSSLSKSSTPFRTNTVRDVWFGTMLQAVQVLGQVSTEP
jgi:hypothetical protein